MNTAQKVRLWIAGVCQALALLFVVLINTQPYDNNYFTTGGDTGSMLPGQVITSSAVPQLAAWLLVFQITAVVLVCISMWKILHRPTYTAEDIESAHQAGVKEGYDWGRSSVPPRPTSTQP